MLFLKIRVLFVHKYILNSCSEGGKDIYIYKILNSLVEVNLYMWDLTS